MIATAIDKTKLSKAYEMINSLTKIHTIDILRVVCEAKNPITQKMIADSLGLTPPEISQTLLHMRKAGIIEYKGSNSWKRYRVNMAKLNKISEAVKRLNNEV